MKVLKKCWNDLEYKAKVHCYQLYQESDSQGADEKDAKEIGAAVDKEE